MLSTSLFTGKYGYKLNNDKKSKIRIKDYFPSA
jgi:hypothetical protein